MLIDGILKNTDEARINMNSAYGKMPISAVAYVTIDGESFVSDGVSMSLYDMLSALDANTPAVHQSALQAFVDYWKQYGIADWAFDFS